MPCRTAYRPVRRPRCNASAPSEDTTSVQLTDRDLYDRGAASVVASWAAYARASAGAALVRRCGVAVAVFPAGPERGVYNNALLERDLVEARRADAIAAMEDAYAAAGVTGFAAWVHESDLAIVAELERRGY